MLTCTAEVVDLVELAGAPVFVVWFFMAETAPSLFAVWHSDFMWSFLPQYQHAWSFFVSSLFCSFRLPLLLSGVLCSSHQEVLGFSS